MRHTVRTAVWILLAAFGTATLAGGIVGTKHDFSSEAWSEGRICLPCHVPHNAQTSEDGTRMVLWNHAVTNESFVMYTGYLDERSDRDQDEQPGGPSKLCLSCHDGATAVDAFGNGAVTAERGTKGSGGGMGRTSAGSVFVETSLGTDLRDDHPIGVQYPSDGYPGYKSRDSLPPLKLVSWGDKIDRVECTSCHQPHSDDFGMFLRMDNTGDALCLQCHDL